MSDFATLVNTNNIRNASVTTPKLADANVTLGKMASSSVDTTQLVTSSVTTPKLSSAAVTAAKLNSDTAGAGLSLDATAGLSVNVERGLQLPLDTIGIADSGIITAYIADSAVTTPKINDAAVTTGKINDAAVVTAKINDAAVTTVKINDAAVTTAKINAGAVVALKLGDVVDETRGLAQDATSNELYVSIKATGAGSLAFDSDNAGRIYIPTNSITDVELADGAVDTAAIQNAAVTPSKADLTATWDFTGGSLLSATPTQTSQVANKGYVDSFIQGLDIKGSCRVGTTANITLSGTQTIEGVVLVAGNRVLVKNQDNAAENGIYVVAAGAWSRSTDMDASNEFAGAFTFIEEGTTQEDTGWVCTTNNPVVVGSTAINWVQFSSAGVALAGLGLSKSGNTFNVNTVGGIQIDGSNNVAIKLVSSSPGLSVDSSNGLQAVADATRATSINASGIGVDIKSGSGLVIMSSELGISLDTNKLVTSAGSITLAQGSVSAGVDFTNLKDTLSAYSGKPAGAVATPTISGGGIVSSVSGVYSASMPYTLVFLNGLLMIDTLDYTTSMNTGTLTITFTDAVSSSDKCVVLYKPATF